MTVVAARCSLLLLFAFGKLKKSLHKTTLEFVLASVCV